MVSARQDFAQAVEFYVQVVAEVKPDQWSLPARGSLTVLEVAAQGSRPLTTTRDFVTAGAQEEEIPNTVGYFVRSKPLDDETRAAIQRRGREALERLQGGDPASIVSKLADEALAVVDAADDDALVGTQFGGMALLPYLPTRTVELVTCGVEVATAIGSTTVPARGPLETVAAVLCDVAIARGRGPLLVQTLWTQVQLA